MSATNSSPHASRGPSASCASRPRSPARSAATRLKKGDLLSIARIAGIQAAKRTDELIPLCHQLSLDKVDVRSRSAPITS